MAGVFLLAFILLPSDLLVLIPMAEASAKLVERLAFTPGPAGRTPH